jgi:hypothetical protein
MNTVSVMPFKAFTKSPVTKIFIPKTTIFGSAYWFKELTPEQQQAILRIDNFATAAKIGRYIDDREFPIIDQELYDWLFCEIVAKRHNWEDNMFINLEFQVEEIAESYNRDALVLFFRCNIEDEICTLTFRKI